MAYIKHKMIGLKFGRLLVTHNEGKRKNSSYMWGCLCECGNTTIVEGTALRKKTTISCGCYAKEFHLIQKVTHGKSHTPEYNVWHGMRLRCYNHNDPAYHNYGGRGITVCDEWSTFQGFFADMGERPSKNHSIDRRDNEKGYSKDNCYWATKKEQSDNRRSAVWIEYDGIKLTQSDWAKKLEISPSVIGNRRKIGQTPIEIIEHFKKYLGQNKKRGKTTKNDTHE